MVIRLHWKRQGRMNTQSFPRSTLLGRGRSWEEVWDEVALVPPVKTIFDPF